MPDLPTTPEPDETPAPVDLSAMTDAELEAHQAELTTRLQTMLDDPAAEVDAIESLAAERDEVLTVIDQRAEQAEADNARREAIRARLAPAPEVETTDSEVTEDPPQAIAAGGSRPPVPPVPSAPTFTAPVVRRPAARTHRAPAPVSTPSVRLSALPGNGHFEAGQDLDVDKLATLMSDRLNRAQNGGAVEWVARVSAPTVPEHRKLGPGRNNLGLVEQYFAAEQAESMTAAGGLCGMLQPLYDVMTLSTSNYRPVARALRSIPADRGGFQLTPGPILSDTTGGSDIISEAEDTAGATAPCLAFVCASNRTFEVDKIPVCNTFGNMLGRTNPEMVKAWIQESVAQRDSLAEGRLLGSIRASSLVVTAGGAANLGAWREYFARLAEIAASYRDNPRRRMPGNAPLLAFAPQWMPDKWMADAARGAEDWMGIPSRAEIESVLKDKLNITMNWYADTPLDDDGAALGANMRFPIQNAGAIIPFPAVSGTAVFAPGVWAVADGGELDFGVTRDAVSNAANNYTIMSEIFEQAMWLGPAGSSIWLEHTACATGTKGNGVTLTCAIS
jgi:hypothetical protein